MLNRKALLVLIVVFTFIASMAYGQLSMFKSTDKDGFYVYAFSEMGLALHIGILPGDGAGNLVDEESPTYQGMYAVLVGFTEEYQSDMVGWGNTAYAFYPTFDTKIADDKIRIWGQFRIRMSCLNWAAGFGISHRGFFASWSDFPAAPLTLSIGQERKGVGYTRPEFTNYFRLAADLGVGVFQFTLGTAAAASLNTLPMVTASAGYYGYSYDSIYNTTDGFVINGAGDEYMVGLELLGLNIEPISAELKVYYHFINTFNWNGATEFGTTADTTYATPLDYRDGYRQKSGTLLTFLTATVEMKDLLYIGLSNMFGMGLSNGNYVESIGLEVGLTMIKELEAWLNITFSLYGGSKTTVDDYHFAAVPMDIKLILSLHLAYTLDMGFKIIPRLDACADLAGALFFTKSDIMNDNKRSWEVAIGADFKLGPESLLKIPFSLKITNALTPSGVTGVYGLRGTSEYGYIYGITNNTDSMALLTKIYIMLGIGANF